ncbi:MAG: DUF4386 family protein [Bacteroidales bacterium]|nr:DUF4386 family protein [Bacteroidales bacterium]
MKKTKKRLFFSALFFSIILAMWPVFAVISMPSGDLKDQLDSIYKAPALYIINFSLALLIGPALVYMLLSFFKTIKVKVLKPFNVFGIWCYIVYLIFITFSYASQTIVLPVMLKSCPQETQLKWYFLNEPSIPGYLNQTGYLIWSLGTILLFFPFFKLKGIPGFIPIILFASALLQIMASFGYFFQNPYLSNLTSFSGILLLPVGILILIFSLRLKVEIPGKN